MGFTVAPLPLTIGDPRTRSREADGDGNTRRIRDLGSDPRTWHRFRRITGYSKVIADNEGMENAREFTIYSQNQEFWVYSVTKTELSFHRERE